jgi:hypothetical protein
MNMDKIDKIREWVKKHKKEELARNSIGVITGKALFVDANELLSFLDTLSKESDTPEFPETFEICLYDGRTPDKEKCTECSTTCSVRKEEPDKSIEEAALGNYYGGGYIPKNQELREVALKTKEVQSFIAGAEWQKSQMLKDAVEGYVNYYEDSGGILMAEAQVSCPYHNGDKVRIVILKEEK